MIGSTRPSKVVFTAGSPAPEARSAELQTGTTAATTTLSSCVVFRAITKQSCDLFVKILRRTPSYCLRPLLFFELHLRTIGVFLYLFTGHQPGLDLSQNEGYTEDMGVWND